MESNERIVNEMFQECTTNERINLPMFVTLMTKTLHVNELEGKLINAFETLDPRKSGNVDAAEFRSMMMNGHAPFLEEEVRP